MIINFYNYLFPKNKQDIRAFRIIIIVACLNFVVFSFFPHEPRIGTTHIVRNVNIIESIIFLGIFILTFFISNNKQNIERLAFFAGYVVNSINLLLTYFSQFEDRFAYQYLIYFLIISLYFSSNKRFLLFQAINIGLYIILLIIANHSQNSDFTDYYLTGFTTISLTMLISSLNNKLRKENEDLDARFKLLAENSQDIISIQSLKGKLMYVSPSIIKTTGYQPEDLLGKNMIKIVNPISASEVERYNYDLLNNSTDNKSYLFNIRNADNSDDWYEFVVKLVNNDQVVLNSRKVTKRVLFQNQLNDKTLELESRNQDLMTFSFIASHDMKEPLRMIIIYQKMLLNKLRDSNPDLKDYIKTSLQAAENMNNLVTDLFSYTKLQEYDMKTESIPVSSIIDNIKVKLELYLQEQRSEIVLENDFLIIADKQMLELVLQNIIQNGLKYNQSDKPRVSIQCTDDDEYSIIHIADNGIGIEEKYAKKIFDAFARLNNKHEYQGTGLGLTISKKIIEKHKGDISLTSSLGAGSTFTIRIKKDLQNITNNKNSVQKELANEATFVSQNN